MAEYNSLISVYLKYRSNCDGDNGIDSNDDDSDVNDDTIVVQLFRYNIY